MLYCNAAQVSRQEAQKFLYHAASCLQYKLSIQSVNKTDTLPAGNIAFTGTLARFHVPLLLSVPEAISTAIAQLISIAVQLGTVGYSGEYRLF